MQLSDEQFERAFQEGMQAGDNLLSSARPAAPPPNPAATNLLEDVTNRTQLQERPGIFDRIGSTARNTVEDIGLGTGLIDPSTYYGRGNYGPDAQPTGGAAAVSNPGPRSLGTIFGDAFNDARGMAGRGEASALARWMRDATNVDDEFDALRNPGSTAAEREAMRDRENVDQVMRERERQEIRTADDETRQGQGWAPWLARTAAEMGGDLTGNANPSYLLGPGRTVAQRMAAQGGINAGIDAGIQGTEINEGIQDNFDPIRTLLQGVAGAALQGGGEAAVAGGRRLFGRGNSNSDAPDIDAEMERVILDQPDAFQEGVAAGDDILSSAGSSPDNFSSPEAMERAVERIAAARNRTNNVSPDEAARQNGIFDRIADGQTDASFAPDAPARTVPDDVTMLGAPEGNVRSDDMGAITAMLRKRAGDENVLSEGEAARGDNPAVDAILNSSGNRQQQVRSIFNRLNDIRSGRPTAARPRAEEPEPEAPWQEPTVDEARNSNPGNPVMPVEGRISSPFGQRNRFRTRNGQMSSGDHNGVDIAAPEGTPIRVQAEGTVVGRGSDNRSGNWLRVRHADGTVTSYAHANSIDVEMGATVRSGDQIGTVGQTGSATGPHLHYRVINPEGQNVDPQQHAFASSSRNTPDMRAPDPETDRPTALDEPQNIAERQDAQRSPADRQLEDGEIFEDTSGSFTENRNGQPYESPTRTGTADRPFRPDDGPNAEGFEQRARQQHEEMVREFEQQRRAGERMGRERSANEEAAARHEQYGQRPAQDESNFWRQTDDGYVADTNGNPVAFRNAREAANFATQNNLAGDFELNVWKSNSERVVLKRRDNSTYGTDAQPAEPAAGRSTDETQRAIPAPEASQASSAPAPENRVVPDVDADIPSARPTDASETPDLDGTSPPPPETRAPVTGETETVVTPAGRELETQFQVRELRDLITSDSPSFDQARQPRNRGRAASSAQIAEIAAKLDPAQLAGNRQAAHGSPIVGPDRMVEVGNGRTMALRRAYEQHPERIAEYQQMVRDKGFDIDGFEQPVLVRQRQTDLKPDEMRAYVNEAQKSGTMDMSAPEQAKADGDAISPGTLDAYRGGSLASGANVDFVRKFATDTNADLNSLTMKEGQLSATGERRIRSAMLSRGFDNPELVNRLVDDVDNNIKAIGNSLTELAPRFANLRQRVADGDIPAEFDISPQVAEAAGIISSARANGENVADLLRQSDMFGKNVDARTESIVRLMFKGDDLAKPRSAKDVQDGLGFYLDEAAKRDNSPGLLGDDAPAVQPVDIIEAARARLAGDGDTGGLFRRPGGAENSRAAVKDLRNTLRTISREADDPAYRDLADQILPLIDENTKIEFGPGILRNNDMGGADVRANKAYVRNAGDVETILHEAIHLAVMRRYGVEFDQLSKSDLGEGEALRMIQLYNQARDRHGQFGFWNRKAEVKYGLSNVDEFVAMSFTNPAMQRWLQRGPIWRRMLDGFRRLLGLPARFKPMLDDVLRTGGRLLDNARGDRPKFKDDLADGERRTFPKSKGRDRVHKRIADVMFDTETGKADMRAVADAVSNPVKTLKGARQGLQDAGSVAVYSNDARLRVLAERYGGKTWHEYADQFHAPAGQLDGKARKPTIHEAVEREGVSRINEALRIIEPFRKSPEAQQRVIRLLQFPNRRTRATKAEVKAAENLREQFKEGIEYRRDAGEDIGEVREGYFPAVYKIEEIAGNRDAFLRDAEAVYRGMGETNPREAAEAWFERSFDTYAGLDGGVSHLSVKPSSAKAREFTNTAREKMSRWLDDDLERVVSNYWMGAARRAEETRRFGPKGREGSPEREAWVDEHGSKTQYEVYQRKMLDEIKESGESPKGALEVVSAVHDSNLGRMGSFGRKANATVSYAHLYNQVGLLDHVTLTSLGDMAMGFVRGGPVLGMRFFGKAGKEALTGIQRSIARSTRIMKELPPSDARRYAEANGIISNTPLSNALAERMGDDYGTAKTQRVLQRFYAAIGLQQLTEGSRVAAVDMGTVMFRTWAGDLKSSSTRTQSRARRYFAELGIGDPEGYAKWIADGSDPASPMARTEAGAMMRLASQTNMKPSRAEKPTWTTHPVGGLVFSLLSFPFAFKKQVLNRVWRTGRAAISEGDVRLLAPALGLAVYTIFQGMNDTILRPNVFGSSYDFENETTPKMLTRVADRAGLTHGFSPFINAATGVRYRRGLAESLIGPAIGRPLDAGGKAIALGVANSPNTNTTERAAALALYDLMIEPVADIASAKYLNALRPASILATGNAGGGIAPSDREAFVTALAGAEGERNGRPRRPDRPERPSR